MGIGPLQGTGGHGGSLVRFIIVGIINTLVGAGVMFFMYNILGAGYWVSSALNYIVGSIVSYFLNKYFTFRQKQKSLRIVLSFCFLQVQIPEICRQKWRILHLRFGESCRLPGRIA